MKNLRIVAIAILTVLLLSSCANLGRKGKPTYRFQEMVAPDAIVVTVDAKAEPALVASAFGEMKELSDRTDRVSLSIVPQSDAYPLDLLAISTYGLVEGDFPQVVVNTGLLYSSSLTRKEDEDGLRWYEQKDGGLSMAAIRNDLVLFADGSYADAYEKVQHPVGMIDDLTASKMADAAIAIYAEDPKTFFDLGIGLPESAVRQIRRIVLLVHNTGEGHTLDAYIAMDTPELADTLSKMVRTGYLARLKREKIPFKISELMKMFSIDDDLLTVEGMMISEEQMELLEQSLKGFVR